METHVVPAFSVLMMDFNASALQEIWKIQNIQTHGN